MSKSTSCDLPFRSVEIEGRHCIFELDRKRRGRFEHVASFYNAELAADYVDHRNDNVDPVPRPEAVTGPTKPAMQRATEESVRRHIDNQLPALTVEDAEKRINETDALVLGILRARLNGSDTVAISQSEIRRTAHTQGRILNSGSIGHSLSKLMRFGLIMMSRPSQGHEPAVYQVARGQLINI